MVGRLMVVALVSTVTAVVVVSTWVVITGSDAPPFAVSAVTTMVALATSRALVARSRAVQAA